MILILAVIRLINRKLTKLPPFPPTMSPRERFAATTSEKLLYALMFALPLVGWGMLSAGHYPIVMFGQFHLPPILPAIPVLYALLRKAHTILAYLLFLTFLAHLSAVLFHTLIIRDRLLNRMALWPTSKTAGQAVAMMVGPATDDSYWVWSDEYQCWVWNGPEFQGDYQGHPYSYWHGRHEGGGDRNHRPGKGEISEGKRPVNRGDIEQPKAEQPKTEAERPNAEQPKTEVEKPTAEEKAKTEEPKTEEKKDDSKPKGE
jgi:cytochrome b561